MRWALLMGVICCLVWTGSAVSSERSRALFVSGEYIEAARLARLGTSDDEWAFAARSTLAYALTASLDKQQKLAAFSQAQSDAEHALSINPDNIEASLHLAIALGHRVQVEGPWSANAWFFTLKARDHIDHALAKDPANSWAHAMLGAWQMSVSHYAGDFLAGLLFGTSWGEGKTRYLEALELAPDNLLLNYYFAEALSLESRDGDLAVMFAALEVATTATPENKLQEDVQLQAAEMLDTLSAQAAEKVQFGDAEELEGAPQGRDALAFGTRDMR